MSNPPTSSTGGTGATSRQKSKTDFEYLQDNVFGDVINVNEQNMIGLSLDHMGIHSMLHFLPLSPQDIKTSFEYEKVTPSTDASAAPTIETLDLPTKCKRAITNELNFCKYKVREYPNAEVPWTSFTADNYQKFLEQVAYKLDENGMPLSTRTGADELFSTQVKLDIKTYPVWDGKLESWPRWIRKVQSIATTQGLAQIFELNPVIPAVNTRTRSLWDAKSNFVFSVLMNRVSDGIAFTIVRKHLKEKNGHAAIKGMFEHYENSNNTQQAIILANTRMHQLVLTNKSKGGITEFIKQFREITQDRTDAGQQYDDTEKKTLFLSKVLDRDYLAIKDQCLADKTVSYEDTIGLLNDKYERESHYHRSIKQRFDRYSHQFSTPRPRTPITNNRSGGRGGRGTRYNRNTSGRSGRQGRGGRGPTRSTNRYSNYVAPDVWKQMSPNERNNIISRQTGTQNNGNRPANPTFGRTNANGNQRQGSPGQLPSQYPSRQSNRATRINNFRSDGSDDSPNIRAIMRSQVHDSDSRYVSDSDTRYASLACRIPNTIVYKNDDTENCKIRYYVLFVLLFNTGLIWITSTFLGIRATIIYCGIALVSPKILYNMQNALRQKGHNIQIPESRSVRHGFVQNDDHIFWKHFQDLFYWREQLGNTNTNVGVVVNNTTSIREPSDENKGDLDTSNSHNFRETLLEENIAQNEEEIQDLPLEGDQNSNTSTSEDSDMPPDLLEDMRHVKELALDTIFRAMITGDESETVQNPYADNQRIVGTVLQSVRDQI